MASVMVWQLLGNAATVAQIAGVDLFGLITKIRQLARTARQNKANCDHLSRRADELAELLTALVRRGPVEPEAARTVATLGKILGEVHDLVVDCQAHGLACRLLKGSRYTDKFKDVEKKLDDCLRNFLLISHIVFNRRFDDILMPIAGSNGAGGSTGGGAPLDTTTTMAESGAGVEFTLAEIAVVTNNFAIELATGNSGTVYKGRLHDGREVAVKRRRRGAAAFDTELAILSPLRHGNIVHLVGFCSEDGERIVVTHLMTNGSLHDHLHRLRSPPVTSSWKTRVEVLLAAARGVEHLHHRAVPLIIHGAITSSHILLGDDAWSPRLTGFAASVWRAADVDSQPVSSPAAIAGDYNGYADPELLSTGMIKPASDVYSFGVVMLEVLTGKPPVMAFWEDERRLRTTEPMTLVSYALPSVRDGRLVDVLDWRPAAEVTTWQLQALQVVASMAVRCLCLHGDNRPGISEVVVNLQRALDLMYTRG